MAEVKRVEAKIILQKNNDGHWLVVDSPSGKHAMVNIENVFKEGSSRDLARVGQAEVKPEENRQLGVNDVQSVGTR